MAEPDRTDADAERVSDIVARLRTSPYMKVLTGNAADIIEAQSKALAEARVVKPLEWSQKAPPGHEHEAFVYWAAGLGGHYRAERDGLLWMAHDAFVWKQHASQKEAKAAAEADHHQRILSALTPTPENPNG